MYRFAPSTTKDIYISDLRIALFNYICTKQTNDMFIVRIEDTDKIKNIEGKDQEILDILSIFGMSYDYLYYQNENFKYHLQFASSLMDKKKAFACFCTDKELKTDIYSGKCLHVSQEELLNNNLPFTIRIKKPEHSIEIMDTLQGKKTFKSDVIDSFIIMTQQKYPTRTFASAIDDMIQGVTHIISDEKEILSTPKEDWIRKSLGYENKIQYTHIPTILNSENISVKYLLDQGFMPEAIVNYILVLSCKTPSEIFTFQNVIEWFRLDETLKDSSTFDIDKLKFINREHIKLVEDIELSKRIGYSCSSIGKLAKLYTSECNTTFEIKEKIDTIFAPKISEEYKEGLDTLKKIVKEAPYFENFDEFEKYLAHKSGLKDENFFQSLSILLTGEQNSSNLADLYPHIKNYLQEIAK